MQVLLEEFKDFYNQGAGRLALKVICEQLNADFNNNSGQRILGYGFTRPILEKLNSTPHCTINYFPVFEENTIPNFKGLGQSAIPDIIGEAYALPFPDITFEKIFCIHSIEESESPRQVLRELWRVLSPEGRLILIVPNRRGVWSRSDKTPFWHGRPYSKSQFARLIGDTMFNIKSAKRILFAPPILGSSHTSLINGVEKIGEKLFPAFGGLLYFELEKRQYIEPPPISSKQRFIEKPVLSKLRSDWLSKRGPFFGI